MTSPNNLIPAVCRFGCVTVGSQLAGAVLARASTLSYGSNVGAARLGNRTVFSRIAVAGLLTLVLSGSTAFAADAEAKAPAANAAATPVSASAKPAPTAAKGSFDSFRLIGDRNIFDPNRRSRTARSASNEPPAPTGDTIAFVGTMDYDQGIYAFFDSADSRYRQVLPAGGKLAEFVVKHVGARSVDLTRDGQVTTLQITQQLHRPDGGEWTVTGASPAPTVSAATEGDAAPAVPADASDILKRLMEQRQKQLKE